VSLAVSRNLHACLVHERPDVVADLVANLRRLDPAAEILLYNGGREPRLLSRDFAVDGYRPHVHPSPRPLRWGRLHDFALDSMRYALEHVPFDTLTVVDSDQLLTRAGYSERLAAFLDGRPGVGLLGNAPGRQPPTTRIHPAAHAYREAELWRPVLARLPHGDDAFLHWTFWPATVFTAPAARALVDLFDADDLLRRTLARSSMWATEEVLLPTLVAALGFAIERAPFSDAYVRYRAAWSPRHVDAALANADVFWIHPVPRRVEHPLRRQLRARLAEPARTLDPVPRSQTVEGWLSAAEAALLQETAARAVADLAGEVVELGSYCGRGTIVLASTLARRGDGRRVHAIDPHDGVVGDPDRGLHRTGPTLTRFRRNVARADLTGAVQEVVARPADVEWSRPIAFLLVDGLHDYATVARDFAHFEPWLAPGALVAFHDYADYFPGVRRRVDELRADGYRLVARAGSLVVLRRGMTDASARPPTVSCVMPTHDRPRLAARAAAYFLRQDYAESELIVLDDGADSVEPLLPPDPRIRYVRLDEPRTIGAKRNLGCELARGDLVAHWDDDDWSAPWRLSYQVADLERAGADVAGLSRLVFYEPGEGRAWRYEWPRAARAWVSDGTFLYTKELWRRNPFPDSSFGIDCRFLWNGRPKRVHAQADETFYVAMIHPENTSRKNTRHRLWRPHDAAAVEALLAGDAPFYAAWPGADAVTARAS
jgi:predicted O-methyltransferase YrrM